MTASRWGALFGIAAAVLLVVAVLTSGSTPAGDDPDQDWLNYINDNSSLLLMRAYMLIASGLCLIAFYALGIRPRLAESDAIGRALAGAGAGFVTIAATCISAGGLMGAAVGAAQKFGDVPVDVGLARTLDNFMYGFLLVGGGLSMGAVMAVVAIQSWRQGAFARWVAWASVAGVIGMAVAVIFLPFVLLPLWLIAVGVALFRSGDTPMAMPTKGAAAAGG